MSLRPERRPDRAYVITVGRRLGWREDMKLHFDNKRLLLFARRQMLI
jgi:hypothetical protein